MNSSRVVELAAAFTLAVLLVSCGSDTADQTFISISASPQAPTSNAELVVTTALTRLFTWFPAREADTAPAFDRARPLLGPPLTDVSGSGAPFTRTVEWGQWATKGVAIVATAQIVSDEHPPDTPTSVSRVVKITQRPTTVDGHSQTSKVLTAWVTATSHTPGEWRVTNIRI